MNELLFFSQLQISDTLQYLTRNSVILIILIPAIGALLALISGKPFGSIPPALAILATLGALLSAAFLWTQAFANPTTKLVVATWSIRLIDSLSGEAAQLPLTFRADALSTTATVTVNLIFLAAALVSFGLKDSHELRSYHSFLALLICSGTSGAILAGDLITLYIFLEVTTLACTAFLLTPLTSVNVNAARKLLLTSVGVSVLLLSSILVMLGKLGTVEFVDLWERRTVVDPSIPMAITSSPSLLTLEGMAVVALLIAFIFRAGIVPLHAWLLDAIDSAISPLGLVLASVTTQLGVYSLIRAGLVILGVNSEWYVVIGILGATTAIVGAVGAINSNGYRRSLAFLAIGQMGFAFISLGAATSLGNIGALFLITSFSTYFPLLFIAIEEVLAAALNADSWRPVFQTTPFAFVAFVAGVFGIAGIPPLNGFAPYLLIYQTLLEKGTFPSQLLLGATVIATGLTAAGAISLFIKAFAKGEERKEPGVVSTRWRTAPLIVFGILSICIGLMSNTFLSELILPMAAAANMTTTADAAIRPNTLTLIEAFVLLIISVSVGIATYLRQNGLLQEQNVPYARAISKAVWLIRQLAPIYRAVDFLLQRNLLDACALASVVLKFFGNFAYAFIYLLAISYLPYTDDEWEHETETPVTEPRAAA